MTRKETLHHFNLACGVLPDGDVDEPLIAEETPGPFRPDHPHDDKIDLLPAGIHDLIAENFVPPPPPTDGPNYPSGGGPPIFYPPYTGASTPPGSGGPGVGTTIAPPPPPATPDVPEPSSYVLLLTGGWLVPQARSEADSKPDQFFNNLRPLCRYLDRVANQKNHRRRTNVLVFNLGKRARIDLLIRRSSFADRNARGRPINS